MFSQLFTFEKTKNTLSGKHHAFQIAMATTECNHLTDAVYLLVGVLLPRDILSPESLFKELLHKTTKKKQHNH